MPQVAPRPPPSPACVANDAEIVLSPGACELAVLSLSDGGTACSRCSVVRQSIALDNRQRPEAFVKFVETVHGRKDRIDRGLASPDRRFSEWHDVRVVATQPGHEPGELTKPDVGPGELCPGQVVPEQFEVIGI